MAKVLVIDDDVAVAELMRVILEDARFDVSVANGESDIPSERFDCVVTDLVAVGLYSYQDARDWVLRLADRFPSTPVIVVTAHIEARADAAKLGARVLMKPFEVEELVAAVRRATADHIRKTP